MQSWHHTLISLLLLSLEEPDCVDRSCWASGMGRNRNWVRLYLAAPGEQCAGTGKADTSGAVSREGSWQHGENSLGWRRRLAQSRGRL